MPRFKATITRNGETKYYYLDAANKSQANTFFILDIMDSPDRIEEVDANTFVGSNHEEIGISDKKAKSLFHLFGLLLFGIPVSLMIFWMIKVFVPQEYRYFALGVFSIACAGVLFDILKDYLVGSKANHSEITSSFKNHKDVAWAFEVIGLDTGAKREEISSKCKALMKLYHPDLNGGNRAFESLLSKTMEASRILKREGLA